MVRKIITHFTRAFRLSKRPKKISMSGVNPRLNLDGKLRERRGGTNVSKNHAFNAYFVLRRDSAVS